MPLNFRPHEIVLDRESQLPKVIHKCDYVHLLYGPDRAYVQGGEIYLGGGDPVSPDEAPAWFWESYAALTPQARRTAGLELPADKVLLVEQLDEGFVKTFKELPADIRELLLADAGSISEAPRKVVEAPKIVETTSDPLQEKSLVLDDLEASGPKLWLCDECGEDVPLTHKGVHIGRHKRLAKLKNKQNAWEAEQYAQDKPRIFEPRD
jgi:hypothetical protein